MNKVERQSYEQAVQRVAKRLGIPQRGNVEEAIIKYCKKDVDKLISSHAKPQNLLELLNYVATSLGLAVKEIYEDGDLDRLEQEIPPDKEPIIIRLKKELDDQTDGIILKRQNCQPWEQPYLAVINCRGSHSYKRYFSKWHEIVHLLLDGKQLRFAFRHTPSIRREPEEILVDRVAAVLAYHPTLFEPVIKEEANANGRLTFDMVDRIRKKIAPEASRQSALIACVKYSSEPICYIRAGMGYKKDEERFLTKETNLPFNENYTPVKKLRVREVTASTSMEELGIHFHKNMEVPTSSHVAKAFNGASYVSYTGAELLQTWTTSRTGPIGYAQLEIEAISYKEEVWALIHFFKNKRKL